MRARPCWKRGGLWIVLWCLLAHVAHGQYSPKETAKPPFPVAIAPERVFDGVEVHTGWLVIIDGMRITAAGPRDQIKPPHGNDVREMPGHTLMPGLIDGHSHILLHPYNETTWNDQVLRESQAERVVRATLHCRAALEAGFTTLRDLGTEGADYADLGIQQAIAKGLIPGPRLLAAGRAIVATGSYGPKGFAPQVEVPQGAEEADGQEELLRVVRDQIGHGVDLVKVYADYRWGPQGEARPTFSVEELELIVKTAASSGRPVVAHATTAEGMRRAILAGVQTIEHGDDGDRELFDLMVARGIALCPTLAAGEAIAAYQGWRKGVDAVPPRIRSKQVSFRAALDAGVTICGGGDVGVFPHGDNARELELMVEYGMSPLAALRSATTVNAKVFGLEQSIGRIEAGKFADLVVVAGDPTTNIADLRQVKLVMHDGIIFVDRD